jgi:hypothetical protein
MLTQKILKELLDYNQDTGIFTWKVSRGKAKAGNVAGKINNDGYIAIGFNYKTYQSHRLAWIYVYGEFPKKLIDHINGIKTDNKISNLRECNHSQNGFNRKISINNTSNVKGIYWYKQYNKWRSQIKVNKKIKFLGYFDDFFEACCSIYSARNKLHGEFVNHGNY